MSEHILELTPPWKLPVEARLQCQRCGARRYFDCNIDDMRQQVEDAKAKFEQMHPDCIPQPDLWPVRIQLSRFNQHWRDATTDEGVFHVHGAAWVYLPDIGNEDEGYGFVMLGIHFQYSDFRENVVWRDIRGERIYPTLWCSLEQPDAPYLRAEPDDPHPPAPPRVFTD